MQTKILKDRPTLLGGGEEKLGAIAPLPHAGYGPVSIALQNIESSLHTLFSKLQKLHVQ